MKISGIDKDFIDIINELDEKGFRPYSSCDGVEANHIGKAKPDFAYIAFLRSPRILDLMAAFLRDKETFDVSISNSANCEPVEHYGNIAEGNTYVASFLNLSGNMTSYFERIIRGIMAEKIAIQDEETQILQEFDRILADDETTNLFIQVCFNRRYHPYMNKPGKSNVLTVATKEGKLHGVDSPPQEGNMYCISMNRLASMLTKKYGIQIKRDSFDEEFGEDEFAVCTGDSTCEIYYTDEHIEQMLEHIGYIKSIEEQLPIFEVPDPDLIDWEEEYQKEADDQKLEDILYQEDDEQEPEF